MKQTTLCFLVKDDKVLLAMKKRGFGVGKWNGIGGKLKDGENVSDAAIRELQEEIGVGVTNEDLHEAGTLEFVYKDRPDWHQLCHVFMISIWRGEPTESEEMRPEWYRFDNLPFSSMWADDPHWLPLVLAEKKIEGKFLFDNQGESMFEFTVREI